MPNNRIFYAVQAVKMRPCQGTTSYAYGTERVVRGIQSIGLNTSFKLDQAYQLGQLDLYSNIEEVPDVEITMQKLLDGTRLLYNIALDGSGIVSGALGSPTDGSNELNLTQISDRRCDVALGIWDDTSINTGGGSSTYALSSGTYVSSASYKFGNDGNFTEDVTLVGNNLKWNGSAGITNFSSGLPGGETKQSVARRWSLDTTNSILPTGASGGIYGTFANGQLHINSVTLSCNLGREAINQLGQRAPYYRYINFPVEVTSEFEVTAVSGSQVNADDFISAAGCSAASSANLISKPIRIVLCDPTSTVSGYVFDLGSNNKLTSANQSAGDTGGGNVTVTYSYQTFNSFSVSSPTAFV
jgi:hypothetical protein